MSENLPLRHQYFALMSGTLTGEKNRRRQFFNFEIIGRRVYGR